MRLHRTVVASLIVAFCTLFFVQPANAATAATALFEQADKDELTAMMQEAANAQDLCYGWDLRVVDYGGSEDGTDAKTIKPEPAFRGTGNGRQNPECRKTFVFVANVTYTSESADAEDSARWHVEGGLIAPNDLRVSESRMINDPAAEVAMVMPQLPVAAVAAGIAPPVPVEANTEPLSSEEHLTGDPGSDWLRTNGALLAVLVIGLLGALALAGSTWFTRKPAGRSTRSKASTASEEPEPPKAGSVKEPGTNEQPPRETPDDQ